MHLGILQTKNQLMLYATACSCSKDGLVSLFSWPSIVCNKEPCLCKEIYSILLPAKNIFQLHNFYQLQTTGAGQSWACAAFRRLSVLLCLQNLYKYILQVPVSYWGLTQTLHYPPMLELASSLHCVVGMHPYATALGRQPLKKKFSPQQLESCKITA